MQPLAGITVIALEQAIAAPFASRHLADLGARVIKVERPGRGDFARQYDHSVKGMSSHFVWVNRSKESLTLNLKHAEGRTILTRLLEQADVFVHNLAPGAVERLGFSTQKVRESFPRLIVCMISGYGSGGSYHEKKAYDLLMQAESGFLSLTGTKQDPAKAGIPVADIAAGMYAFSGILMALYQRAQTGKGVAMEVSLFDALGEWMGYPAYYTAYSGKAPERAGASHATIAPYGPFSLGDGSTLLIGIQNEGEWERFCGQVLCQPELLQDQRFSSNEQRVAHRPLLDSFIQECFSQWTIDQAIERLEQARIAYGRMRTMHEFLHHPQRRERQRLREVASPVGPVWALLPPVSFEGIEPVFAPIPEVGQQTEAILQEIGFSKVQISEMRRQGTI